MARTRKKPITAARVERAIDTLAGVMATAGPDAPLLIPLWKRLQSELERLKEEEAILAAAMERVKQSRDQTAARSS
ncbi:hypothetical protein NA8A_04380 [Nitratireductor indicus C115]|uniref:Uncharacterized protein n=2 Tax=Nitratireductor indicus TaxID=721133 RepID=K2N948_9HYPH|nr:hypothetical protein NA8A_04380 [Nitratireductor indicus C115]SFQ11954.1 hypothetical protein SAMN05216176_101436 [Nitratireductor indicus]